jgi:hypothetical protein
LRPLRKRSIPGVYPLPEVTKDVMDNLFSRNQGPVNNTTDAKGRQPARLGWAGFKSGNKQIVISSLDIAAIRKKDFGWFWEEFPHAKGVVWVWLPGYSPDGQTALVELLTGPAEVHLVGAYVLTKKKGKWVIKEHYLGPVPM